MAWLELSFSVPPDEELAEIFSARLAEIGFDSFLSEEEAFKAYVDEENFELNELNHLLNENFFSEIRLIKNEILPEKNWNEIWESDYQPVIVNSRCRVRAPFHKPDAGFEFDLLIEPRMSFGTAHHETTSQVIKLMLDRPFEGKSVLDMGSGTAVLAILARKMKASPVVAIDNDEWAYNNALDNIQLNQVPDVEVALGDAAAIGQRKFDVVIANINRNILLNDMGIYIAALEPQGQLLMSGFYEADLALITDKAVSLGLKYVKHISENQWVAALYSK